MRYKTRPLQKTASLLLLAISWLTLMVLPIQVGASDSGKAIFEAKCGLCHVRPDPENLTAAMWVSQLETMAPMAALTAAEKSEVLEYLQENSGTLEQLLAKEKVYFEQHCSACHAAVEDVVSRAENSGNQFEDYLIEHVEDKADKDLEEKAAHEVAEYLLHYLLHAKLNLQTETTPSKPAQADVTPSKPSAYGDAAQASLSPVTSRQD